ncbi:hypothetical protein D3C78_1370960 [compost metagenome]
MAQVHLPVHMGQQRTDGAAVELGHVAKDIPINLLQPQAGGEPVQTNGSGQGTHQLHVEPPDERIDADGLKAPMHTLPQFFSLNHTVDTPLPYEPLSWNTPSVALWKLNGIASSR